MPVDETRLKHALLELKGRGLLKADKVTFVQRVFLKWGRDPRPLEYATFGRVTLLVSIFAAIPFTAMFWPAFAADEKIPGVVGLAMGLGSGLFFGVVFAAFLWWQRKEMKLTPWEKLDQPPEDAPDDAATVDQITTMVSSFFGRMQR